MVSGWQVWILLRILNVQKLWDFNFTLRLALDLLDGLSIERYEENCESFDLFFFKIAQKTAFEAKGQQFNMPQVR